MGTIANYIKTIIKKITTPSLRKSIRSFLGKGTVSETEIVFQLFKNNSDYGIMFDIGAHHGDSLEAFARDGWKIYAFEPDPKNRKLLKHLCRKFLNVHIDERAVSEKTENGIAFYSSEVSSGISSLSSFHPSHKEACKVDIVSIEDFCSEKSISHIDFLKIDTEGFDYFVLKSVPWWEITPEVIVCEFEDNKSMPLGYTFYNMADFLKDKGYHILVSEWYPISEYGTTHKWRCFRTYPCKLIDQNAWGNIVAVKDEVHFIELCSFAEKYDIGLNKI